MRVVLVLVALAAVVGCSGSGDETVTQAEAERRWELARAMSLRRSYIAAAEVDGAVYAAGGMVGESGRRLAVFQRYDAAEDSWTTLPRLPEPLRAAAAAAVGRTIYVTGGQTRDGDGRHVYAYDVDDERWRSAAPLPEQRFNHAAVALGGRVYVLGGFAAGIEQDEVFAYDPERDAWSLATRLPRPAHAFGAVAFRGEIWVVGGIRADEILRDVWVYSPDRRTWRRGPQLPKPMELLGLAVAGDELHAVWESVYQIYDARTARWRQGPPMRITRHGLEAFAIDGMLYAIGGCTTALRDSPVVERIAIAPH